MKPDLELQRDVLDELDWGPGVNAAEIGVSVEVGVITLTGFVGSYAEKLAAERAAERVKGVRGVAEEIQVKLPTSHQRTDAEIARAALSALEWDGSVPNERLQVKVERGWVTLEGEADWAYQRDAATEAVRNLTGVKGVMNLVTLRTRFKPADVKAKIAAALTRSAELDAERIEVETSDGRVVLTGNVHSWVERDEAARAAWAAPGAVAVENHLMVAP